MVLKAFLSRCPEETRRALERFLPENERLYLAELPSFSEGEISPFPPLMDRVHWSWFLPTLKSFSAREQRLFLASLHPLMAENLRRELQIKSDEGQIGEVAGDFLRQQLLSSLAGAHNRHLPIDYLPASPLNRLLYSNKKDLIRLIDLLALYDLAADMRQIVETKILKKIYSFLSEEQKNFLKKISSQKETHTLPRMGLERWDGSEEALRVLLHKRGLARLGIALSGQDPDLIWAICHQLDIGRGNALFKLCGKEAAAGISEAAIRQIEEIV
jgi:hypothetical protein